MNLRERLTNAAKKALVETLDNSKEIIADNIVPGFEEMGMASVKPGEFSQEEITDQENLVNKANMSNDNDFNASDQTEDSFKAFNDIANDLVDISGDDDSDVSVEIVKTTEENPEETNNDEEEAEKEFKNTFGESRTAKIIESALVGKSAYKYLKDKVSIETDKKKVIKESEYAGPLNFVPDMRINTSDVIRVLKNEIGKGSEAIHVDQFYDDNKDKVYKVSSIDPKLLPDLIQVENQIMLLDKEDNKYRPVKLKDDYPLKKN